MRVWQGLELGPRVGRGSAFHPGLGGMVSTVSEHQVPDLSFVSHSRVECGGHRGSCPCNTHSPWILDFWHLVRL